MKGLKGFIEFIGESSRLARLGLYGLNDEQKEFLDYGTDGTWKFDTDTGLVNIDGNFYCNSQDLTDFKGIRFGKVSGDFICSFTRLTSLKHAPQQVGGSFDCSWNALTSLKHAPQQVGGDFWCSSNLLTSLEGASEKVGGGFDCSENPDLQSLAGLPKLHDVVVPKHLRRRLGAMRTAAKKLKSKE